MKPELTERQKLLLSLVVHEHTRTAQPVGSKTLVEQFALPISSATIRNEMTVLTELGYLRQPHTSAGRVPTEEGYRFFVSNLAQQTTLPAPMRNTIAHQFYQARQDLDEWLRLAASVLANQSQAASIVTAPHTEKAVFKHLELISTRAAQVLMVLVLVGGEIRQQILSLDDAATQESLSELAGRINSRCANCSVEQINSLEMALDPPGPQVLEAVRQQMRLSQKLVTGEIYLDGVTNVLAEPEFADTEQARSALSLLEERSKLDDLLSRTILGNEIGGVQVLIGGEGTWQELRQCSVILTRYGIPDQLTGTVGVLGPMRMPYGRTISTVRFVAGLLSDLVAENLIE
ncbi:MAG: heat-inducible transcription repressor HrcA [Chloroflexi bacterium]|jgi:heat-inducible transcriptional repressor|nr:heat-inducible transcription repressor HrcA [Chloroflexota bacterium]HOE34857.1 heat-inducible transcriptional repressor HrcA [Anaerolineaceae bacterium]HOT25979.1 heat-inducible transcriptional repressor HrcA [Anaerolineaceae bacterium]HQK04037.1 heat-inducible transcriptional repressor HrcA [Anaerolineaceae bacterium]HQL27270.1 heat-inducible transcriptional repressor HrcA [Anaerolineaceae bacterium]